MNLLLELPHRLRRVTQSGAYRPEIDGLRFWAILPVMMWHGIQRVSRAQPFLSPSESSGMLWIPEGWTGVVLFFTISGFIISTQFIRHRTAGSRVNIGSYFYRRVTRIEPPYLILLTASYLVFAFTPFRPQGAVSFWRGNETFTQSYLASIVYVHGVVFDQMPRLFAGGWSLEVEIQFYILAPAIFALLYLAKSINQRLIVGITVLIITILISYACDQILGYHGRHSYTIIKYFSYFWLGALLAEISAEQIWPKLSKKMWDISGFSALIVYMWSGIAQHSAWGFSSLSLDVIRVIAFFFLFGGAMNGGSFRALCSHPWISLIGGACYSIYLSHVQVIQVMSPIIDNAFHPETLAEGAALALLIQLPLVLVVGLAVYTFVERPFMTPHWPERLIERFRSVLSSRRLTQPKAPT